MDVFTLFLIVCLVISLSYEVHGFWRYYLVLCFCKQRRKQTPKKLLSENEFKVICLTTDLDISGTMTTGRVLRECSAGQLEFRIENFLFDALKKCGGTLRNEECHVTYTRPIKLFETFVIKAKLIYWDAGNLYLEQTVVLNKDKSVCAVVLTRQKLVHATMGEVLEQLNEKVERPELTETIRNKVTRVKKDV